MKRKGVMLITMLLFTANAIAKDALSFVDELDA